MKDLKCEIPLHLRLSLVEMFDVGGFSPKSIAWIRFGALQPSHKALFAWIAMAGSIATLFRSIHIIETKAMMHEGLPVVNKMRKTNQLRIW